MWVDFLALPTVRGVVSAHIKRNGAVAAAAVGLVLAAGACVPFLNTPLPTATATLHWATVDLPRGGYCWSSGGHAECADSAGPDTLLKTGYLKPYRTAGGFDATVHFHGASDPGSFRVTMAHTPTGVAPVPVQTHDRTLTIPRVTSGAEGVYVYGVTGVWNEGDVSFFLALDLVPGSA